ncbi:DUF3169 family protein [Neobacillus mesonae]|nr:DUF3169 family protein [Neobacillus mesonae]
MEKKIKKWLQMPLYAAGGGLIGYTGASLLPKLPANFTWTMSIVYEYDMLFAMLALTFVFLSVWNIVGLSKIPRQTSTPDIQSDELYSPAERAVGRMLIISSINVIVPFTWVALALAHYLSLEGVLAEEELFGLINFIAAVLSVVISIALQNRTVKRYNLHFPDRAFDLNASHAHQQFFEKLDEGEKWVVYRSAYRSFRIMDYLMIGSIIAMIMYSLMFQFAPFPIILLSIIWLVHKAVYFYEASKRK